MNHAHFDRARGVLFLRTSGFWDVEEARSFLQQVTRLCAQSKAIGRRLTVLSNVSGLVPQIAEVVALQGEGFAILREADIARYILVIPSAMSRVRFRRALAPVVPEFFDNAAEALTAAGYTRSDIPAFWLEEA
ncbi:MAG: hypothetical protein JWR80_3724 [Bradyrhizobium sp.]|nr:hypothetical protein [Bradyrhizobium sp.]